MSNRHLFAAGFAAAITLLAQPTFDAPLRAEGGASDAPAAETNTGAAADENAVPQGHSYHGEAFNEGPRQAAYLRKGMGGVHFPVTTESEEAQAFFNQGVAQLHGFYYFEAERSFRQVAALDPDCAMAYWGMAMANTNNKGRAEKLVNEAVERKEQGSVRERRWIDALAAYYKEKDDKKRRRRMVKDLERIIHEHPEDLEAKAFLLLQLYKNRRAVPFSSYFAVDALAKEVLAANPLHPVHHYRIHLWDYEKPARALDSAARCGPSAPGVAHMWHMPGHIYSRLKRYNDAAWQQEASARVDHAQIIRDRLMPDQIHNFAHNNEWLCRNLSHTGRVREAVDLAKNMVELPRMAKLKATTNEDGDVEEVYQGGGSSYGYGRRRLLEVVVRFEQWERLLQLSDSPYLGPEDGDRPALVKHHRLRAIALHELGRGGAADADEDALRRIRGEVEAERAEAVAAVKAEAEAEAEAEVEVEVETEAETDPGAKVEAEPTPDATSSGADEDPPAEDGPAGDEGVEENDEKDEDEEKPEADEEKPEEDEEKLKKAVEAAAKPFDRTLREIDEALSAIDVYRALAAGDNEQVQERVKKVKGVSKEHLARIHLRSGNLEEAEKIARSAEGRSGGQVAPLATLVEVLGLKGGAEAAREKFDALRSVAGQADLDLPVFDRLKPLASALGYPADWRLPGDPPEDLGERPDLDSLGPFRWHPSPAPDWKLPGTEGEIALADYRGKPVVVIFFLGQGCSHCIEQLQLFAPVAAAYAEAGISLVAVSTDSADGLAGTYTAAGTDAFPFPLVSDQALDAFKAYRAYDDFEQIPLHGTFLIDGQGLVRWQDISYEPFEHPRFLLDEAQRLLGLTAPAGALAGGGGGR